MRVKEVKWIKDYILEVTFINGKVKRLNFSKFLSIAQNPMTTKYRNVNLFKKVYIEHGHLSWNEGEMAISAESVYNNDIIKTFQ